MEKIVTDQAPKALGPYTQAVKAGGLVFVSGQLPIDLKTGKLISGDIRQLTAQVFSHLKAILEASGSSLDHVVRCDVFLTDLQDFQMMNEEYSKYFKSHCPPARQTIQVAALPLGSSIEISCIAIAN
ncbi:MAG: RidA family protein [Parachlamydiaceae bacterium]